MLAAVAAVAAVEERHIARLAEALFECCASSRRRRVARTRQLHGGEQRAVSAGGAVRAGLRAIEARIARAVADEV